MPGAEAALEQKTRPAGAGRVGPKTKIIGQRLRERFGDFRVELHGARMIAFNAIELVASLQHAVELVDQHGNRLVTFVRLHGRIHIGPLNLDVALSRELHADRGIAIARQLNAHSNNALLVTKQSLGFLADERLQRRGQFEVNARDD